MSRPALKERAAPAPPGGADAGPPFSGFPSSGLATAVPNLFFSRLLPLIERPEELVVSLYLFFAAGVGKRRRRSPRFVSRRELAADAALMRALGRLAPAPEAEALDRGLALAVRRGTLLRVPTVVDGRPDELYLMNSPAHRGAARELAGGAPPGFAAEELLPPADGSTQPNIFALYEENIGAITPLVAEELKDAEERYPADWLREAVREAVSLNKRNWRYISRILRRWEAEGPDYEKAGRDTEAEWLERRYAQGRRRRASRRAGA